ncbi:bifunctional isocitrate dehydrogenase kinase/phosphatase [Glaciecola sp. MH2013]|uniref:bifunctional isocitrate dehydrogenase kinase/phosphatase n=1 Tax=Glaciecola sp. MH2013 TaxID=2785524 RepID=UPI00189E3919|nr:bifunctional isocitrate dehydrogenase kinase/phosphatase [Glaciecola sp. MH2013]MBF7071983.1 bifunctional isocitrate dehydrogenase kinase/phosphatase [Glaciecola sp. MH2013]
MNSKPDKYKRDEKEQAQHFAYQVIVGFDKSYRWFSKISAQAKSRFENAQWAASQAAVKERIAIYEQSISNIVIDLYEQVHPRQQEMSFWRESKAHYAKLLNNHPQFELAETFYNSVIGRIFKHCKIDDEIMFVLPSRCYLPGPDRKKVIYSFDTTGTVRDMYKQIFATFRFNIAFDNHELDLDNLDKALRERLSPEALASVHTVEILRPVFYRGKAAYLVGRICMPDETLPFVIALQSSEDNKLMVDALLTERRHLSVIFSFARSYFMADTQYPAEVVAFLQELLPHKKHFELYMALGFYKHGKTVFYRNYLQHLENSEDQLALAPGIKGLVMTVFHLPSYGVVFKVIKDEFAESKKITREHVKDRYRLVKTTDRVGRMADTHEYVNFRFPKQRINNELLHYLQETCASSLTITEHEVIISHLYIERKMTPLNLYLQQEQDKSKIRAVIDDLGICIKQIAAANVFPGDMLHKNFGVTKTGRVIFYDYDEICYMSQRQFRAIPKSDDPYAIDTLSVGPTDVFPEQFEHFIIGKKEFKDILKELHGDIMTPEYWQETQAITSKGDIPNFSPYPASKRFRRLS